MAGSNIRLTAVRRLKMTRTRYGGNVDTFDSNLHASAYLGHTSGLLHSAPLFLIRLHWVVNSTASTNGELTNGFCSSIKKRKGAGKWLTMHIIWSTVSWIPRQTCMTDQAWWIKHMHRISWLVGRITYIIETWDSDDPIIQLNKTKWTPSFQYNQRHQQLRSAPVIRTLVFAYNKQISNKILRSALNEARYRSEGIEKEDLKHKKKKKKNAESPPRPGGKSSCDSSVSNTNSKQEDSRYQIGVYI